MPLHLAPLVLVVMSLVYSLGAYPAGQLSDRIPAKALLLAGMIALILADLALALATGLPDAFLAIALWGAHLALTQGLFAKLVADHSPSKWRGSAYGVFILATGIALLFASIIAGLVWVELGAVATFICGAGFSVVALMMVAVMGNPRQP